MGWTAMETVETVGEGGLEAKLSKSTNGARDRVSMGRVVAYGGEEGCNELAGVGDALNPLDFATLETLAFTRMAGLVEELSGERREGGDAEGVGWNEPLLLRALGENASADEVKERCLDKL
jgi:hypothetical protein